MKRRKFLLVTAAGILGLSVPASFSRSVTVPYLEVLARPNLLDILGSSKPITEIGHTYLAAFRGEYTTEDLARSIVVDVGLPPDLKESSLRRRLANRIADDFSSRRTLKLNGWVLSETEARQCALYTIVSS